MAIVKQTVLDRMEIDRMGRISVRLNLEVYEDSTLLARKNHRFVLEPGMNTADCCAFVNTHLESMNMPAMSADQITRLQGLANLTWTAEVLSEYAAMVEAATLAAQEGN